MLPVVLRPLVAGGLSSWSLKPVVSLDWGFLVCYSLGHPCVPSPIARRLGVIGVVFSCIFVSSTPSFVSVLQAGPSMMWFFYACCP